MLVYKKQHAKQHANQPNQPMDPMIVTFIKNRLKKVNTYFVSKYGKLAKVIKPIKLSDKSIISKIVTHYNDSKLSYDVVHEIISKAHAAFQSYFAKMKTEPHRTRKPNYLEKDGKYIIPLYTDKLTKRVVDGKPFVDRLNIDKLTGRAFHGKQFLERLTKNSMSRHETYIAIPCGSYIAHNYPAIVGNHNLVVIFQNNKTTTYGDINNMTNIKPRNMKNHRKVMLNNVAMYIHNGDVINAGQILIKTTDWLFEQTKYIEIVPSIYGYKIMYTFHKPKATVPVTEAKNYASIDMGMANLITLFSTSSKSMIIPGTPIKSWNRFYGFQLDYVNKELSRIENSESILPVNKEKERVKLKKRRMKLLLTRKNKVDDYLKKTACVVMDKYCKDNKIDVLVIGKNEGWKTKSKLKGKINRDFQSFPFARLINYMEYKGEELGIRVITNEESYTSKCDSLAGEAICRHDKYLGEREMRGLFKSSTGAMINADVNGAINILRKGVISAELNVNVMEKIGLLSKGMLNPRRVNVWKELSHENNRLRCMRENVEIGMRM